MPTNAVSDLWRNILALPGGPTPSGVPEISRSRGDRSGPDFAGMLSDNLRAPAGDARGPRPEPTKEGAPRPERPVEEREKPPADRRQETSRDAEPASDGLPAEVVEGADRDGPTGEKSPTAGGEQPSADKEAGEPTPGNDESQVRLQPPAAGTPSAPTPMVTGVVQAGVSAVLEALFSTNTATTEPKSAGLEQPVGPKADAPTGASIDGQGQTSSSPPAAASLQVLKSMLHLGSSVQAPSSEAQPTAAPPGDPDADNAKTPADSTVNKVLVANTPEGRSEPPKARTPRGLPTTQAPTPAPAKAPLADTSDQPSKPSVPQSAPADQAETPKPLVPIQRALVIREDPGAKLPDQSNGAARLPTQTAPGDPAPALDLARLLLDAKVTTTGDAESSLQADHSAQQAKAAYPQTTTSLNSAALPSQPGVTPTAAAADTGGSSWEGGQANQAARNMPLEAGETQKEASPLEQVVRVARAQIGARHSQVRLQLQPPELGQLRIDVRMNGKSIRMHVQTQTETTHQIISSRISDLRSALETQGLTVERVHVELRGPSQTSSSSNHQDQSGLDNPLRDAHPDSYGGGHPQSEYEPEGNRAAQAPVHLAAGADEEDAGSAAAMEAGVNIMA